MKRIHLILFFLIFGFSLYAQNNVKRSTEQVVIKGKSYYLHVVDKGQTLYSIAKAYGIKVDELKQLNDRYNNNLSLYDVLKIPVIEPSAKDKKRKKAEIAPEETIVAKTLVKPEIAAQLDKKNYYYHTAKKGETLFSIARSYDVKARKVTKENKEYDKAPLAIGSLVKIAWKDIDDDVAKSLLHKQALALENELKKAQEAENASKIKAQEAKDALDKAEKEQKGKDYLTNFIFNIDATTTKVVVMLPFDLNSINLSNDTLTIDDIKINSRTAMFANYYQSILLAIETLRLEDRDISLYVMDTDVSDDKFSLLLDSINKINPDIILGPVFRSSYKKIVDGLANKNTPVIYPLSTRIDGLERYHNSVLLNAPFENYASNLLEWLSQFTATTNIINLKLRGADVADQKRKQWFRDSLVALDTSITTIDWNMDVLHVDSMYHYFVKDRENIIVMPFGKEADVTRLLPMLVALADDYPITVIGLPEWQSYTTIGHESFFALNVKIPTYSHVDYNSAYVKKMTSQFRNYHFIEPDILMLKMYEIAYNFIKLANIHRDKLLSYFEANEFSTHFGRYKFVTAPNQGAKINLGFSILNYTPDYQIKVEEIHDLGF